MLTSSLAKRHMLAVFSERYHRMEAEKAWSVPGSFLEFTHQGICFTSVTEKILFTRYLTCLSNPSLRELRSLVAVNAVLQNRLEC